MLNALKIVSLSIGVAAVVAGMGALRFPEAAKRFCRELPRNEKFGRILMLINVGWSLYLLNEMNLGDWNSKKPIIFVLGPLIYLFIIFYVNHYLGARSLAWFLILMAKPVVNICFLRDEPLALVITTIAYIWVVAGICFFSVPHWFRDWMIFWQAHSARWIWGCRLKISLGVCLIILGLFVY